MGQDNGFHQGMGFAARLGTEMVAATLIGAGMGYALDWLFGTRPWFLALGVIFGGAAGCLGVYRTAMQTINENNENDNNETDSNP